MATAYLHVTRTSPRDNNNNNNTDNDNNITDVTQILKRSLKCSATNQRQTEIVYN